MRVAARATRRLPVPTVIPAIGADGAAFPIEKMQARVKKWIAEGIEIKIFTARATPDMDGKPDPAVITAIQNWCLTNLGKVLEITNQKTYDCIEFWFSYLNCPSSF